MYYTDAKKSPGSMRKTEFVEQVLKMPSWRPYTYVRTACEDWFTRSTQAQAEA